MIHNVYYLITVICICIVLTTTASVAIRLYRYLKSEICEPNRIAVIFLLLFQLSLLMIDWPGIISIDDIHIMMHFKKSIPSSWQSFSYSFLCSAIFQITNHPFLLSIFNWILFTNIVIIIFSITKWEWEDLGYWILIFALCLPHTSGLIFFQNRDSTYSLITLTFLLSFLQYRHNRFASLLTKPITLVFLGCVLGEMRQEGKIITIITPFLIWYFIKPNKRATTIYTAFTIALALVIQLTPAALFNSSSYNNEYKLTAFMNPLIYITNKLGAENLSTERKENIDRVLSIEAIKRSTDPYDIWAFHEGGLKIPVSNENYKAFVRESLDLIWENPSLFIENRWLIFKRMFLFEHYVGFYSNSLRNYLLPELLKAVVENGAEPITTPPNILQTKFYKWSNEYQGGLTSPFNILISSCLIAFISLLFFVMNFRRNPYFAIISLVILGRSLIIVGLAPAAYFKYVSTTWIMGWLLLLIYWNIGGFTPVMTRIKTAFANEKRPHNVEPS